MDLNEVMAMVISTQENVSQTSAAASHLLRKVRPMIHRHMA